MLVNESERSVLELSGKDLRWKRHEGVRDRQQDAENERLDVHPRNGSRRPP